MLTAWLTFPIVFPRLMAAKWKVASPAANAGTAKASAKTDADPRAIDPSPARLRNALRSIDDILLSRNLLPAHYANRPYSPPPPPHQLARHPICPPCSLPPPPALPPPLPTPP